VIEEAVAGAGGEGGAVGSGWQLWLTGMILFFSITYFFSFIFTYPRFLE